jgi:integrase
VSPPRALAVRDCVECWLAAKREMVRAPTWADYREKAERYLVRPLGRIPLARLRPAYLSRYYHRLEADGLSRRTVRYIHELMLQALQHAVALGWIPHNPARLVRPTPYHRTPPRQLDPVEVRRFLALALEDEHAALWYLLACGGLQPSEALALQWIDIAFERRTVRVTGTLRVLPGGRWERFPLCRNGQRREIPLPEKVLHTLSVHRERQSESQNRAGPRWQDHGLVFTGPDGCPLRWAAVCRRHFRPLLRRAGLPLVPAYSLRHTCVTMLLRAGIDPWEVSRRAGYTSLAAMFACHPEAATIGPPSRAAIDPFVPR